MNYNGSPRTMAFPVPSTNQGASIYPGAILDEEGVNLDLWVASGVIHAIDFSGGTALIPVIEIYDFTSKTTGRPLSDGGTYTLSRLLRGRRGTVTRCPLLVLARRRRSEREKR